MIEYVKGPIAELTPALTVIDCHGVGYGLNISLNTFSALQGKQEAKLYVYEAIREDAHVLFGFSTRQERALFLLLISVSGSAGAAAWLCGRRGEGALPMPASALTLTARRRM